jgi:hypothetical protein
VAWGENCRLGAGSANAPEKNRVSTFFSQTTERRVAIGALEKRVVELVRSSLSERDAVMTWWRSLPRRGRHVERKRSADAHGSDAS